MIASTPHHLDDLVDVVDDDLAACRVSASARRAYLRDLTTGRTPLSARMRSGLATHLARLAVITNEVFGTCEQIDYAWWLGLELDHPLSASIDDSALESLMRHAISTLRDPHCALLAAIAADAEHRLDRPEAWRPSQLRPTGAASETGLGTGAWLDLVGGPLGYRWTDWERQRLTAAAVPLCTPAVCTPAVGRPG